MKTSPRTRHGLRIGAGVAALVGLSALGAGSAMAASGFDPAADAARVGGVDRYATAALIAQESFPNPTTVIVANGETDGIDALSASYLAGIVDAPILLTQRDSVPAATAQALAQLKPQHVIVVGAAASVSAQTYADLVKGATGERIAGTDRYDTSEKLLQAGLKAGGTNPTTVFLARGDGSGVAADALSASPVSYRAHVPVLLVRQDGVPEVTTQALATYHPGSVFVLGNGKAVSASVDTAVSKLGATVERLQGSDRTETAAAIAGWSVKNSVFTGTSVGFANGRTLDGLVAGPAAGKAGRPLLLTESATSIGAGTDNYLKQNKDVLTEAKVYGSPASVSTAATEVARSSGGGSAVAGGAPAPSAPVDVPVNSSVDVPVKSSPVKAQIGVLEIGATTFTVTFGGPIDGSTLGDKDFSIARAQGLTKNISLKKITASGMTGVSESSSAPLTPKVVHVDVDTSGTSATISLDGPLAEGDVVMLNPASVNSLEGVASPASVVTGTVLPASPSNVTSSDGDVVITPTRLVAGTPVVTELRDGKPVGEVDPVRITVGSMGTEFTLPTVPGTYTYLLKYLDGTTQIASNTLASGSIVVKGQIVQEPVMAPKVTSATVGNLGTVIVGDATAGSSIKVFLGDVVIGTTVSDENSEWSIVGLTPVVQHGDVVTVTASNAGGISPALTAKNLVPAPVKPALPEVKSATVDAGGSTISGSATPGSTVSMTDGSGHPVGQVVADGNGSWSFTPVEALMRGGQVLVTAENEAGTSKAVAATWEAPVAPTLTASYSGEPLLGGMVVHGQSSAAEGSTVTVTYGLETHLAQVHLGLWSLTIRGQLGLPGTAVVTDAKTGAVSAAVPVLPDTLFIGSGTFYTITGAAGLSDQEDLDLGAPTGN